MISKFFSHNYHELTIFLDTEPSFEYVLWNDFQKIIVCVIEVHEYCFDKKRFSDTDKGR